MRRVHDISIGVRSGGLVYPGNPDIRIELQQAITRGEGANVSRLDFGSHTGTHVDAAKHFFDDGQTIDQIDLDRCLGPAIVLEFDHTLMSVTAADLARQNVAGHSRVLLHTRNSSFIGETEFHRDYTYLAPDGAEYLVEQGVELVGIDYLSIEQFHSGHHRTHRTLLEAGVVIVEGLNLDGIAAGEYDFICLPLKLEGLDGAPARALLVER